MTDTVPYDSPAAAVQDPGDYFWRASSPDGDAHAFPPVEPYRLQGRAACGARWTAAYGHPGARMCGTCVAQLRDQLRAIVVALAKAGIHVGAS